MKRSSWEASRRRVSKYRKRNPTENVLYQVIYEHRQEFEWQWQEYLEYKHGCLRDEVIKSLDLFLNCGILFNGCAYLECTDCKYSELLAFSCKQRTLCPSCSAKRALTFSENLVDNILNQVPHAHAVFTIPKRLRPYFKFNRKLNKHLYTAAWRTIQEWCEDELPALKAAMVSSLHTAGDLLNWHPHVHSLVALGAFTSNGEFEPFENIDTDWLTTVFARNLFELLEKESCIEPEVIENLRQWQNSGFNVWIGEAVKPDNTEHLKFLASYLRKSAVVANKLKLIENNTKVRITKKYDGKNIHKNFLPLEFMAEVAQHIPDTFEQMVRYYGAYSARSRGVKTTKYAESEVLSLSEIEDTKKKPSFTWANSMKKVFEIDPLVCPRCAGEMVIRNFIFDSKEIARIAKYSGQVAWQAPPPLNNTKAA